MGTGCARAVDVAVAPLADDPRCAEAMVDLPDDLDGRGRLETTAQSTAAWGDPAVTWRCGLEPTGPTTEACYSLGGVDWVAEQAEGASTFTTFGRSPTVQVRIPDGQSGGTDVVLATFAAGVEQFPVAARCRSLEDLQADG